MHINIKLGEPLWRAVGARRLALEWPDAARVTAPDALARLAVEHTAFAAAYAAAPYRLFVDAVPADAAALADGQTLFILLPAIGG